jgi:hypothetical protein
MTDEITDEECITLFILHATRPRFQQWEVEDAPYIWGCWDDTPGTLSYETHWRTVSAATKAGAARKYCELHGLLRTHATIEP